MKTLVMGASLDSLIRLCDPFDPVGAHDTQAVFVEELGHAMMLDHHWLDAAKIVENWLLEQGM